MNVNDFKHIARFFPDGTKRTLMLRKGAYPYDYMTSITKLNETELPAQTAFYNQPNEEPLPDVDYEHAKQVWVTFACRTLRDYHDLYLHSDVYLLRRLKKLCLRKILCGFSSSLQFVPSSLL